MPDDLLQKLVNVPSSVTFHSLIEFQGANKDQGDRGACDAFSFVSALEAAYHHKYGLQLNLSSEYFIHYTFSVQKSDHFTGKTPDGFIPGENLMLAEQFGLPSESDCPAFCGSNANLDIFGTKHGDQDYLEIAEQSGLIHFTEPNHSKWTAASPQTQTMVDAFEYDPRHIPWQARRDAWYGAEEIFLLPAGAYNDPYTLKKLIYNGYEVRLSISLNQLQQDGGTATSRQGGVVSLLDAGDGQTFAPIARYPDQTITTNEGHAAVLVAFDTVNKLFLLKNSWAGTPYLWVPYYYFQEKSEGGLVITSVRAPNKWDGAAAWLGRWKIDRNGWQGELVLRNNRPLGQSPGTFGKLGIFVDRDGATQEVHGWIDPEDNTAHLQILFSNETGPQLPGEMPQGADIIFCQLRLFGNRSSLQGFHAAGLASKEETFSNPAMVWGVRLDRPGLEFTTYPGSSSLNQWPGYYQVYLEREDQPAHLQVDGIGDAGGPNYEVTASYQGTPVQADIPKSQKHRLIFSGGVLPDLYLHELELNHASGMGVVASGYHYVGNHRSKELHLPGCSWILRTRPYHKRYFQTLEEAFEKGYNGCYYCLPGYDLG